MTATSADTWAPVPQGSGFGVQHLPYGVFSRPGDQPRCGVRIGDHVLDLARVSVPHGHVLARPSLNEFLALGPAAWAEVRERVTDLLTEPSFRDSVQPHLFPLPEVRLHLAWEVADYVDFYSSQAHAENVGQIFRPDAAQLPPSWKHLPIGYHGRAGTIVVSGTPVVRPSGQLRPSPDRPPVFGRSQRLDIEAEVGFVVGAPSALGTSVPATAFAKHVFGVVLVNDWSARDIQAFEYQPLGPFLGKSFATSVSAWVTPLAALAAARVPPPAQDPTPVAYLADPDPWSLDLAIEVELDGEVVSRPPFRTMYWTPGQQLAHLTVNGASLRTGDLFASGTVSGRERDQRGSLLELSWGGREPVQLASGRARTFLEDGDTVVLRASAPGPDGTTITLGEVSGRIEPAIG
ncbi:MAG TPA: fumarylacetoacetase [Actinomycetes bacterium]